jgi:hypothetical protein
VLLRSFTHTSILIFILLLPLAAQDQPAPATPPVPPPTPAPKKSGPDYPDPRTITVGVFYWYTIPGSGPDIQGGKIAAGYESLFGLGKYKPGPAAEVSVPITRTGVIHVEAFDTKGDGSQLAPIATTVYSTSYIKGDYLSTQYNIRGAKLYLEDLLYPYKFPAAKFRLRSLWEVQYVGIKGTVDAPLKTVTTDSSGNTTVTTGSGSNQILLPSFGVAAEYAIAPHILLRAAGTGFGLPHKSEILDAEATVSYRHGKWEIVGGAKALHVKTSPQKDEYVTATMDGAFVGVRWHF